MSVYVLWFVVGFVLLVAELLTGTFYLLVLAVAAAAAGLTALAGGSFALQLVVAAAIALAGSFWLRRRRGGRGAAPADNPVQHLDVGQSLRIEHWSAGRTARATYRGAQWDVELVPGEEAAPGEFVIREIQGSRLVVAARR